MPIICDIRSGAANNVIQVGGKLFIEGVEFTTTNLAPVAFSQGPTAWGGAAGTVNATNNYGLQAVGQLCLPRTYVRGSMGVFPALGAAGQFDSTKIACGQDVEGTSFVYSAAQGRYYGAAGDNTQSTLSSFDADFRILNPGLVTATALATNSVTTPGFVFLPSQNDRWFVMQASSCFVANTTGLGTQNAGNWGTLTEAGVWTTISNLASRYPVMPYIGSDWILITGVPHYPTVGAGSNNNSIPAYMCVRDTGTMTTLTANWLSATTPPAIVDASHYQLCFPSNAIVATPGSEIYFYQPTMSASVLNVWIGTVSNLASTPTISPSTTTATVTSPAGVDTTNDWIVTSADVPNFSRVRFTTSGTLPAPLALATDYWTIRLTSTTSRLATSYANAVAGTFIDLTTAGTGTQTLTTFATLNIDTSQVDFPGIPGSNIYRNVRAWTFSNSGTNYLCIGVYEPGTTNTVPTTAINLYLWRLDSKTASTFIQKVTLGDSGRVRSLMQLDSTGKNLAVVYDNGIAFWSWNSSTNWTFLSTQSLQTQDVGVDDEGRVWATGVGSYVPGTPTGYNYQSLYVFEPAGAAARITVEFEQSAYTYTGSSISSNVVVNAYDISGARVAISVTLTRDSTNFDFSGNPSATVTTSTSGNTLVPISVFSTGLLSLLAVPT
jgi:hypothetical protein